MAVTDTDTGIRALTLAEVGLVGGAGTLFMSTSAFERVALQARLTETYKARREDELGNAIREKIAGFGS